MALREVLKFPDKRLRTVSQPIAEVTDEIRALANDMLEVVYDEPGIGLAAPQVGEPVRLIVVDTEWTQEGAERNPLVLVNPEIHDPRGRIVWTEGCLSVPDFEADVERAETSTATKSSSKPAICKPSASSTRSTTSTASCSSTASAASSEASTCRSERSSFAANAKRPAL
jgi:peptide deformylase